MNLSELELALSVVASKKEVRYYLQGIYITSDYIVASDGHRLVKIVTKTDIQEPFIIDTLWLDNFIKKCKGLTGNSEIVIEDNYIRIKDTNIEENYNKIDRQYPKFDILFEDIQKNTFTGYVDLHAPYVFAAYTALIAYIGKKKNAFLYKKLFFTETFGYYQFDNITYIIMRCRVD